MRDRKKDVNNSEYQSRVRNKIEGNNIHFLSQSLLKMLKFVDFYLSETRISDYQNMNI
jgi:hypothetical protein